MKIELIATGDELTKGTIADTNSATLAFALTLRGYEVTRITIIGDDLDEIAHAISEASHRADALICAGGLGPTSDDLTAESAAKSAGVELEFREEAWRAIEERFAKINLPLAPTNRKQAMLPKGAEIMPNPIGTAPGFVLNVNGVPSFFAPGVPKELFLMFEEQVLPRLEKIRKDKTSYAVRVWRTFGYTESGLGELLTGIAEKFDGVKLSFRAVFPEIMVGLSARAESKESAEQLMESASDEVEQRISQWVYTRDNRPLPQVVGDLLREKSLSLAIAESCTGGMISGMITSVAGSSDYFLGGVVSYSNELKIQLLGVSEETIEKWGAVSEECAREMALGVRKVTGADIGLGITGIAGPGGGTPDKPVGTVWIACAMAHKVEVRGGKWLRGDREQIRLISSFAALDLIRRVLISQK